MLVFHVFVVSSGNVAGVVRVSVPDAWFPDVIGVPDADHVCVHPVGRLVVWNVAVIVCGLRFCTIRVLVYVVSGFTFPQFIVVPFAHVIPSSFTTSSGAGCFGVAELGIRKFDCPAASVNETIITEERMTRVSMIRL